MPSPDALEIEPDGPAAAAVIWLHGLGADAWDFHGVPPQLGLPAAARVRWVFPNAPYRPITINGGAVMRAWYDIRGFDATDQDLDGMRRSAQEIDALIDREMERGVPINRIVLGGFSQGGVMSLFAGLQRREQLAGIVCLSGYLASGEIDSDRPLPIFLAHGTHDPVVPLAWGQVSAESLTKAGYPAEWHAYPMEHTVCGEELQAIGRWLTRILGFDPSGA